MNIFSKLSGPTVTYSFLDKFISTVKENRDMSMQDGIVTAASETGRKFSVDEISMVADRIVSLFKKKDEAGGEGESTGSNMLLANYSEWLSGLPTDQRCLLAADWDYSQAKSYYCDTDISIVEAIIALKYEANSREHRAMYEIFLYAQGGHLAGDAPKNAPGSKKGLVDLSKGASSSALAELKLMGF